jgi:hypothetical protein
MADYYILFCFLSKRSTEQHTVLSKLLVAHIVATEKTVGKSRNFLKTGKTCEAFRAGQILLQ